MKKPIENDPVFCDFRSVFAEFEDPFSFFSILKGMAQDRKLPTIEVQCYSGYKADEKPVAFVLDGRKLMVEKIIDRWRSPEFEYFKVIADDGKGYVLKNDYRKGGWALETRMAT